MKYQGNQARTTTFGRAPRRTNNAQQLQREYDKLRRMGFTHDESRFKALHYHSMKL